MKNEPKTEKAIAVQEGGIVMPAVTPEKAVEAWAEYQTLKKRIMTSDDVQVIQGKEFLKKSYWRKIATFFNLSVEITQETHEALSENNIYWNFTCKAIAPNGRFAFGVGSCDQMEKGRKNTIHNTRGTAETRAFNRAVANLVGGGEVSAEEMVIEDTVQKPMTPRQMAEKKQDDGYVHEPVEESASTPTEPKNGVVDPYVDKSRAWLMTEVSRLMGRGKIAKDFASLNKATREELIDSLQKAA